MGESFYDSSSGHKDFILNHYRSKKIRDGYLLTTDFGSWIYLSPEEFKKVKAKDIDEHLLSLLLDKGIAFTPENVEKHIKDSKERCSFLFQGTSLHIVVPTLRCNIKCVYCHSRAEMESSVGFDMDEETAKKTVDFIFESPSPAITIEFQGGEPLLRFDLVKFIIKYATEKNKIHKKDLEFSLVTNLTLMTEEILSFLIKNKIGICTSLDGNKIVHNKNRMEYDKTVGWIKRISEIYHLNAMPLITKNSLPYYKEIIDEYVKLGFWAIWLKPLNYLGFASKNWENIGITAEEFLDFYKKALAHIIEINKKRHFRDKHTGILLNKILKKKSVNFLDLQVPCGAAIGQLAYNYDGNIYTCDEGRFFGDVFKLGTIDNSYKEVLSSSGTSCMVKASMNDNPVCELCAYKPYCGLCPVCSYSETGNIITKLPDRRCDIYMGMFDYLFEKLLFDVNYRRVFLDWMDNSKKYK